MNLGETIFCLRSERNLSQGDLANALDVSRQSVSKWENNNAVPELDKLIKLSELFEITLDELVREGKPTPEGNPAPQAKTAPAAASQTGISPRKIVGTILLCLGVLIVILCTILGSLLTGLLFASPFLLCGLICFIFRQHVGLWCGWAIYFAVDLYLRWATSINWRLVLYTRHFTPEQNYLRLASAWVQVLWMLLMVVLTVFKFRNTSIRLTGYRRARFISGWVLLVLLCVPVFIPIPIPFPFSTPISGGIRLLPRWFFLVTLAVDWVRLGMLTCLMVLTVCSWRTRKGPVH